MSEKNKEIDRAGDANSNSNSTTSWETLDVRFDSGVIYITLNRPDVLNALNSTVLEEIEDALVSGLVEHEARVAVLRGQGSKAFAAGADIAPMARIDSHGARHFARLGQRLTQAMETMPLITIACVQGFALGGGCELAMACDLILAGESARFGQPEVNLGLIPGFGGTQRLAKRVGLPLALDMLCCGRGRTLTGRDAYNVGLVSRVVSDDKLDEELESMVKALLAAAPTALAECKRLARQSYDMSLNAGLAAEADAFAQCFTRDESQEGLQAFLERREPRF